ncbi:hypothetical protein K435DRAFT_966565 [Dendrothele bispora CBS 962.96]|uniref:DUF6534 domain-containing protein n=1 Tax=Dendrothele bispora (strain CBS 962.96) TaxID=1314807 RepID=A0A4S8LZQ8_DENBC|nr:hypothetical protein K435DRAFT_966565 [Dendrothele bispora CBS 962.96]
MSPAITIDTTLGFLFHSVAACCILYGVAIMQGLGYFRKFKGRDGWGLQTLVATVLLCETGQIAFLWSAVYKYAVTSDPTAIAFIKKELIIQLLFSGAIGLLVQHFYCYRIYMLSKNFFLAGLVSLCSIGCVASLYYFVGLSLSRYTLLSELALQNNVSVATNVMGLLADVCISFFMIILLQRSKTGFKRSTDTLNRLIIFSVNTGLPTSLCSILTVVLIEAAPGTFVYIFVYLLLCHFYTICLLVTLNERDAVRSGSQPVTSTDQYAVSIPLGNTNPNPTTQEPIAIRIHQTTQNFQEEDAKDSRSYGHDGNDVEAK